MIFFLQFEKRSLYDSALPSFFTSQIALWIKQFQALINIIRLDAIAKVINFYLFNSLEPEKLLLYQINLY